jgi:hypothetical protein
MKSTSCYNIFLSLDYKEVVPAGRPYRKVEGKPSLARAPAGGKINRKVGKFLSLLSQLYRDLSHFLFILLLRPSGRRAPLRRRI